jgi:UDP-galactopyranose mutase
MTDSTNGALLQNGSPPDFTVLCLSHLRWDFVFQRPHHLMSRLARERTVIFLEEPKIDADVPWLERRAGPHNLQIAVPHLQEMEENQIAGVQRRLLDQLIGAEMLEPYVLWYYTPMALEFTSHLSPIGVVYDCMDELAAFNHAPIGLQSLERELFRRADLVFTGGQSLYESKRMQHDSTYCFPSSVDVEHFAGARTCRQEPADQQSIPHPRLGFYGVIDERFDLDLLAGVADARPDWQLVIVGPVAETKFNASDLPRRANIHYLGGKSYVRLPEYLAGWDIAMIPFARNESTRFISPTKTPEYLAAGRPVVSTSIADVVHPYGDRGLVRIADDVSEFVEAVEAALAGDDAGHQERVDAHLRDMSWDRTWAGMRALVHEVVTSRTETSDREQIYV